MRLDPRDVLAIDQDQLKQVRERMGDKELRKMLSDAQRDLEERISAIHPNSQGGFGDTQMRATLEQVKAIQRKLGGGIFNMIKDAAHRISDASVDNTLRYLKVADNAYRGVGTSPLALNEAGLFTRARQGVMASLLHRFTDSTAPDGSRKAGILTRYGAAGVMNFEDILRRGMVTKQPWLAMRQQITDSSTFLKGAPAHWAERIVRTEVAGAHNRASWESNREAEAQLGDMLKILSATFDNRTSADSYAVHGQCRRPNEPFDTWEGKHQHPPARPNDREIIVPHRIRWDWPKYLTPKSNAEVSARWREEGRKKAHPPRPKMTTVKIPGVDFPV